MSDWFPTHLAREQRGISARHQLRPDEFLALSVEFADGQIIPARITDVSAMAMGEITDINLIAVISEATGVVVASIVTFMGQVIRRSIVGRPVVDHGVLTVDQHLWFSWAPEDVQSTVGGKSRAVNGD